jgi:hypothetical protein
MSAPQEVTELHTRLLRCALEIEESRAYWAHVDQAGRVSAQRAFDEYWFGAKSLSRIKVLLANMRVRFDAFPAALETLRRWPHMSPDTRRVICHWHLQLADPLYRAFTGDYLVTRRAGSRVEVTRDLVVRSVKQKGHGRWTMPTHIQFASKLLSAAFSAGLVATNRDPRPILIPRVPDEALEYLMYLLREVRFDGTLLENPYVSSVGLEGSSLEDRLRGLPGLVFRRQGDLIEYGWRYADLRAWCDANVGLRDQGLAGVSR